MYRRGLAKFIAGFLSAAMIVTSMPVYAMEQEDGEVQQELIEADNQDFGDESSFEDEDYSEQAEATEEAQQEETAEIVGNDSEESNALVFADDDIAHGEVSINGNLKWKIDKDKCLWIAGTGDYTNQNMSSYTFEKVTPWKDNVLQIETAKVSVTGMTTASGMFSGCEELTSIEFVDFDTENIQSMSLMFQGCKKLAQLDLGGFDTKNVVDMYMMFNGCNSLSSLNVSSFDTSKVQWMGYMFSNCKSLTILNLDTFNTGSVGTAEEDESDSLGQRTHGCENMSYMFNGCENLTNLDLSKFDTSNATDMRGMFQGCSKLANLNIDNFDTKNVWCVFNMFSNCESLTSINLTNFDTSKIQNMACMFENCVGLTNLDLSHFDLSSVNDNEIFTATGWYKGTDGMLKGCRALNSIKTPCNRNYTIDLPSGYGWSIKGGEAATEISVGVESIEMEKLDSETFDKGEVKGLNVDLEWSVNKDGLLTITGTGDYCTSGSQFEEQDVTEICPWLRCASTIKEATVSMSDFTNTSHLFAHCNQLKKITFEQFDTSNVTDMSYMFSGCSRLTDIDLNGFDTSKVKDMSYMFFMCSNMTKLDLTHFVTSSVETMFGMFYLCSKLEELDVSKFETLNVTNMGNMFAGCAALKNLDVSKFNTSKVIEFGYMFMSCSNLTSLSLGNFDTSQASDMYWMFKGCSSLQKLDISSFEINRPEYYSEEETVSGSMLDGCTALIQIKSPKKTDEAIALPEKEKFVWCLGNGMEITEIPVGNESLNIQAEKNIDLVFGEDDIAHGDVYINGHIKWKIDKDGALFIQGTGEYYQVDEIDDPYVVSGAIPWQKMAKKIKTAVVDLEGCTSTKYMFPICENLESVDLAGLDTSHVTDMSFMFYGCSSLKSLELGNFDTAKVVSMSNMFWYCSGLKSVVLNSFNTANVTNMSGMFGFCTNLESLCLSNFDTSKVKDMRVMFAECDNLKNLDLSAFDLSAIDEVKEATGYDGEDYIDTSYEGTLDFLTKCDSLETIKTPKNIKKYPIALPIVDGQEWYMPDGKTTTTIPLGTDSITVVRKEKAAEKKSLTVSGISVLGKTYDQNAVTYTGALVVKNEAGENVTATVAPTITYVGTKKDGTAYESAQAPVDAGNYALKITVAESEEYLALEDATTYTFEIKQAPVTITAKNTEVTQGDALPEKYEYEVKGLLGEDKLAQAPTMTCLATDTSKVGEYDIVAADAKASANYSISYVKGKLTIKERQIVDTKENIAIYDVTLVNTRYDGTAESHIGSIVVKTSAGEVVTDQVTPVYTYGGKKKDGTQYASDKPPVDAGDYTVKIIIPESEKYHAFEDTNVYTFEIKQAPITITVQDKVLKAGAKLPSGYEYEVKGLLGQDTLSQIPSFMCTVTDMNKAGEYEIIASGAKVSQNYEISYVNGKLILLEETPEAPQEGFVVATIADETFATKEIKPVPVVYDNGKVLKNGVDYTVSYQNNINVGINDKVNSDGFYDGNPTAKNADDTTNGFDKTKPYILIQGKGAYTDTLYVNFNIVPASIGEGNPAKGFSLTYKDQNIADNNKAIKVFQSLKYTKLMNQGTDYEAELIAVKAKQQDGTVLAEGTVCKNQEVPAGVTGSFRLVITGNGNYTGTIEKSVAVAGKTELLKNAAITLGANCKKVSYKPEGATLTPAYYDTVAKKYYKVANGEVTTEEVDAKDVFVVKNNGKYLVADKDYTISYENNNAVGKATLVLTGIGDYFGTKSIQYTINGTVLTAKNVTVKGFADTFVYTGKSLTQEQMTVALGEKTLGKDADYTVIYKNNINKGKATVTIEGKAQAGYSGKITKTFKIDVKALEAGMKDVSMESIRVGFVKGGVQPAEAVKLSYHGKALVNGKDYALSYKNNKAVADEKAANKPTIVIKGKGNFGGSLEVPFVIAEKSLNDTGIQVAVTGVAYNSKKADNFLYKPAVKVTDSGKALANNKDYKVTYVRNTQADVKKYQEALQNGSADADSLKPYVEIKAVSGSGYIDAAEGNVQVELPVYLNQFKATSLYVVVSDDETQTAYTGKQVTPNVEVYYSADAAKVRSAKQGKLRKEEDIVKAGLVKLTAGKDYSIAYGTNVAYGKNKGTVTVTGTAPIYGGSVTEKFTITGRKILK